MTTKSGPKKEHWSKAAKAKSDAADALCAEYGVSTMDELREMLEARPKVEVEVSDPGISMPDSPPENIAVEQVDPLAFITSKMTHIGIVSSMSNFTLRAEDKSVYPHVKRVALAATRSAQWAACPFFVGDRNNWTKDTNVKVQYEKWWHLHLTRQKAQAVYSDERSTRPPEEVVKDPRMFQGWDKHGQCARGEMVPLGEFVPLREIVRRLLQKNTNTFMDWLSCPQGFKFDRNFPNPYRNRLMDVTLEFNVQRDALNSSRMKGG